MRGTYNFGLVKVFFDLIVKRRFWDVFQECCVGVSGSESARKNRKQKEKGQAISNSLVSVLLTDFSSLRWRRSSSFSCGERGEKNEKKKKD